MIVNRVTVFPDVPPQPTGEGGFKPSSFDHLLHLEVHVPGLDPTWKHTVVGATVADDGTSAEITVCSEPVAPLSLDRNIRITTWQPAAHVKAHDVNGNELTLAKLDAPLRAGQLVEVGGDQYLVSQEPTWPGRDPATGVCVDVIDWQHVVLRPAPEKPHVPTALTPADVEQEPTKVKEKPSVKYLR